MSNSHTVFKFYIDSVGHCRDLPNAKIIEVPGGRKYVISPKEELGRGAFGSVCVAYRVDNEEKNIPELEIDPNTGLPKKYAVKKFRHGRIEDIQKETQTLGNYYPQTEELLIEDNEAYLVTEFLPGSDDDLNKLNNLSFPQRINLITQILMQFNLMHHKTPRTGAAIVHRDAKLLGNIIINIDLELKKISAHVIDLGASLELEDEDKEQKVPFRGTPNNVPPEAIGDARGSYVHYDKIFGYVGTKSDIRALAPIIMFILGAFNPYSAYDEVGYDIHGIDINALLSGYESGLNKAGFLLETIKDLPSMRVQSLLTQFVNRMADVDYDKRPSSDETLRFFNTLNLLCKDDRASQDIYLAKLTLLASGLRSENKTFEQFDFEANPSICSSIIEISNTGDIDREKLELLLLLPEISMKDDLYGSRDMLNNIEEAKLIPRFNKSNLLSDAITTENFNKILSLLFILEKKDISLEQKKFINSHRERIVNECAEIFKTMPPSEKKNYAHLIQQRECALGAILKEPRSPRLFKLMGKTNTRSIEKIMAVLEPKERDLISAENGFRRS